MDRPGWTSERPKRSGGRWTSVHQAREQLERFTTTRLAPVHVAPVPNLYHGHHTDRVFDLVDHAVMTYAYAPRLPARQLLTSGRAWLLRQALDSPAYPFKFAALEPSQRALSTARDLKLVAHERVRSISCMA